MAQDNRENRGIGTRILTLLGAKDARPALLCPACGREKARLWGLCARCAESLPMGIVTVEQLEGLNGLCAALAYDKTVRRCIWAFKYRGRKELADLLARRMADCDMFEPGCVLIPVPLHPKRQRQRGFSQTELLAARLSELTGRPVVSRALRRTRNTPSQSGLHGKERRNNPKGAFDALGVRGLRIILVDDVVGTGATLRCCAEALKEAGAEKVYGLTAAAAIPMQEE